MDKASIKEAYARVRNGEVFLDGMNITPYEQGNRYNHDPVRTRKLLLHRREIEKLIGAVEQQGLTLVPLELYFKNGRAKVAHRPRPRQEAARQARRPEAPGGRAGNGAGGLRPRAPVIAALAPRRRAARAASLSPPRSPIAGLRGEVHIPVRLDAAGARWWRRPRSSPRSRARSGWTDRLGGGDRLPPAVPLPGGRAALSCSATSCCRSPARPRSPATACSCPSSSSPRSCPTISATAIAGTPERARLDRARGRGRPALAAAAPRSGEPARLPNGLRPGHIVTVDPGHGGVDPGNPGVFFPRGTQGEGRHPPDRPAAARRAQAARGRRPDDPHDRHPDRARRPGRLLYRGLRPLRQPSCELARPARATPTSAASRPSSSPRPRPRTPPGWPRWRTTPCASRPGDAGRARSVGSTSSSRTCSSTSTCANPPGSPSWCSAVSRTVHTGREPGRQAGRLHGAHHRPPAGHPGRAGLQHQSAGRPVPDHQDAARRPWPPRSPTRSSNTCSNTSARPARPRTRGPRR